MIEIGMPFPLLKLNDQNGKMFDMNELIGAPFLVYFYPKDDTSGCTAEACDFRDSFPKFKSVKVIGVSPDSPKSHKKFADKYSLPFVLLADEDHKLAEMCGVWVEKSMYGKKYMGVQRSTFLMDESGKIVYVWENVKPQGHAEAVLMVINSRE